MVKPDKTRVVAKLSAMTPTKSRSIVMKRFQMSGRSVRSKGGAYAQMTTEERAGRLRARLQTSSKSILLALKFLSGERPVSELAGA